MMENELLLPRQQRGGRRLFECKTCGRRFPTFQALGGHRASHRRPGPYGFVTGIRKLEAACAGGPRVHGCPICGAEFAVGQALGGHMRRHRAAAASAGTQAETCSSGDTASATVENRGEDCVRGICLELNLALPASCAKCQKDAGLGSKVQGVQKNFVFDCIL